MLLLGCVLGLQAQQTISNRANAMGETGLGFTDVNAVFTNQAGIASLQNTSALVSAERRFELSDLSTYSLGLAIPSNAGTFGISINHFGFEVYNQQRFGLVYARQLLSKLSIGGEINYHNFNILEYGSVGAMSFELSLQYQIGQKITIGTRIANPIEREFTTGEHLPTVLELGMRFQPSQKVSLAAEVEKQIDMNPNFRAGLEYQLIDILFWRVGISSNPHLFTTGIGLDTPAGFKIDFAIRLHQYLGWSPGLSLVYAFDKK